MNPNEIKEYWSVVEPILTEILVVAALIGMALILAKWLWQGRTTNISQRMSIYVAVPLFLGPLIEKVADIMLSDKWPSLPRLTFGVLLGVVGACIGLKALHTQPPPSPPET